ncbi:efflux RND transporter periplasmic adaptor subunit [Xanthocytophaga agilis]|uniref:Efflux RND transporter periplasmic adaptor subunit n=1 Tax=Xanthocytophaga agilis TaxID=3048010 RepID=A0AAE3UJQ4_9BACT|nr:efflux RND transporter periplasmic adaptor subunit [Xanthocytophaga agilis]MDJ1506327.1 efflux RND transporter periplasmic adaptor subunit [Xanthocytophaga agilis]
MQLFAQKGTTTKTILFTSLSLLLLACGNNQQQQVQAPLTDVDFLEIQPATAHEEKKYPGSIEGSVNVDIKAQVTGYLDQIYVSEGDFVQKGQSLFRIKGDVYKQQVNNSQAFLKAALATEENARIELEKIRPLVAGKVVSQLQLQTAEANYASAQAQVAQARAALGSSEINAAFSLIKAPVSGYIGRIPNRIGNLVNPADATPLTTLSEINNVFVYFSLSEADFISFVKDRKAGEGINTVELIIADGTLYDHKGKLEIASGNIDRTTGSIPLKAVFPNPDKLLRSGGSGKVILRKTLPSSLTVPMSSVKDIQNKYFVFTLADSNKITMKPIEIAGKSDNNYILKTGLKAGDKVAINRIDALNEGMVVKPDHLRTQQAN